MEFRRRKWGWYLTLIKRHGFKVKLLWFKDGGEISLQRHKHRAELWLFVFGLGRMTVEDSRIFVGRGFVQSVPKMAWHHYEALRRTLVIEVQIGKCDEEDIERG